VSPRSFVCAVSANRSLLLPAVAGMLLAASLAATQAQQPAPTAAVAPQPAASPQSAARQQAQAVTPTQTDTPKFIYSPWAKFCGKGNDPNAEEVCFTDQNSSGNSFAKTDKGRPIDPKVFEAQQKKLQDELQKRADEARKSLESQSSATPPLK
jgi:vancomycin resistance protein YoaR